MIAKANVLRLRTRRRPYRITVNGRRTRYNPWRKHRTGREQLPAARKRTRGLIGLLQKIATPTLRTKTRIRPNIVPTQTAAKILTLMEAILALRARKTHSAQEWNLPVSRYQD